jgi:hypothetical protein
MRLSSLLCLAAIPLAAPAQARDWQLGLIGGARYDSNVFRLAKGEGTPDGKARDDGIGSVGVNGRVAVPISLQRVRLNGSVQRNVHLIHDDLTHTSYQGEAVLDYRVNRIVSGSAGISVERRLSDFDYVEEVRNLERLRQPFVTIRTDTGARFFALAEWRRFEVRNSNPEVRSANSAAEMVSGGLGYELRGGQLATLQYRQLRYRFPEVRSDLAADRVSGDSKQEELEGRIDWVASGKTRLIGRAAIVRRRFDRDATSGNSLFNGSLNILYRATPITTVNLLAQRAIAGPEVLYQGSGTVTRGRVALEWRPKTYILGEIYGETRKRKFDRLLALDRDDVTTTAGLRLSDTLKLGSNARAGIYREVRRSDDPARSYAATVIDLQLNLVI